MSSIKLPYELANKRLLVNKRRSKVKDKGRKGDNTEHGEQVSAKVRNCRGDHIGSGGQFRKVGNIVDHVDLGGFSGYESWSD